jgi:hypothetical protein
MIKPKDSMAPANLLAKVKPAVFTMIGNINEKHLPNEHRFQNS